MTRALVVAGIAALSSSSTACVFVGIDGGPCEDASKCPTKFPVCRAQTCIEGPAPKAVLTEKFDANEDIEWATPWDCTGELNVDFPNFSEKNGAGHIVIKEADRADCAHGLGKDVVHDIDMRLDVDVPAALGGQTFGVVLSLQRNVHDGQTDDNSDDVAFVLRDNEDKTRSSYFASLPNLPPGNYDALYEETGSVLAIVKGSKQALVVDGPLRVRLRAEGQEPTHLFAKLWRRGALEPPAWNVEAALDLDQAFIDADQIAFGLASGLVDGEGVSATFSNLVVYRASELHVDDAFPVTR